jgi:phosphoglycerate dehydrogenase-like enzyme
MAVRKPTVAVLTAAGEDPPPGLDPLYGQAEVRHADGVESLREHLPESDVLLVTDFRTDALRRAWSAAERLRWIHAASAGVDAVLFDGVVDSEVTVTNARGIFDAAIAEYVLGAILMFAKDSRTNIELRRRHEWRHRDTERIAGKQVLVVGAGSIGRAIARLCRAAGMRTQGVARRARGEDADFETIYAIDTLGAQLPQADYVVLAAPLTPETRHLFDDARFAAMHPSARFINIARGPLVDTEALVRALRERRIAGAALDVFEDEPLPPEHPLWDLDNVLISAHMAGDFIGWREALSQQFLDNLARWRAGEPLHNVVDKARGYVPPT